MTTLPKVHCNSKVISEDKFSKLPNLPISLLENVYQFLIEKFCVGNSFNKIKWYKWKRESNIEMRNL